MIFLGWCKLFNLGILVLFIVIDNWDKWLIVIFLWFGICKEIVFFWFKFFNLFKIGCFMIYVFFIYIVLELVIFKSINYIVIFFW